jgi:hypothetical protein
MPVASAVMKKRHFQLDHLRLRYLYRIHIQKLELTSLEIDEYSILMQFLGRDLPTNQYDIKTEYKKYSFIRYCKTNKRYKEIPIDMVIGFINIQENLN